VRQFVLLSWLAIFLTTLPSLTICKIMKEKNVKNSVETGETDNTQQTETIDGRAASQQSDENAELEKLKNEAAEWKDKYIRQVAEFDNFRKRNAKEKLDLIQTAGKDVITSLLDVLDDSERAQKQLEASDETTAVKEGVLLVFNKFRNVLQSKGLKAMESIHKPFDPDMHEAITEIPAPTEELKGKVLDEVQKGYYLNDKIIRFAKVVVGK
jgi:molecular chaperone GrpE